MKYAQHRASLSRERHKIPWKIIGGVVLGFVIIIVIIFAVGGNDESVVVGDQENGEVVDGVQVEFISADDETTATLSYEEIELLAVDESGSAGIARRENAGGLFTHVVVANLPPIETQYYFYEGWLVKPGITDFFSTGEMFARDDGKWGIVWEVDEMNMRDDLDEFSQVVITLEPRDGNTAPSARHVLEGKFE